MDLLLIEWVDAHSGKGWQELEDMRERNGPLHCRSVGWLISQNQEYVTIAAHLSGERNENVVICGCGDLAIPRRCIVTIKVLHKGRKS
jgi:hypothetical protein